MKYLCGSALLFTLIIYGSVLNAQERGRLNDGRAFRIDENGNQLVDYIAELELDVESLTRKVSGLQSELAQKESMIKQMEERGVSSAHGDISEKTLVKSEQSVADNQSSAVCPAPKPAFCPPNATDAEMKKCSVELENSQRELQQLKRSVLSERGPLQRHGSVSPDARAALKHQEVAEPPVTSRQQAINTYRQNLSTELLELKELTRTRDALYREFAENARGIQFKPSSGVSSQNRTVADISREIETMRNMQALASLSRDVTELKRRVHDDINLLKRIEGISSGGVSTGTLNR